MTRSGAGPGEATQNERIAANEETPASLCDDFGMEQLKDGRRSEGGALCKDSSAKRAVVERICGDHRGGIGVVRDRGQDGVGS